MNTILAPLAVRAREAGDDPAVVTPHAQISYRSFEERVRAAAGALARRGVRRNERVGIVLPNGVDHLVTLCALFRLGAVAAPISTRLPAGRIPGLLRRIDADRLVTKRDAVNGETNTVDIVDPADLLTAAAGGDDSASVDLDAPATIVFTSGSSGRPKATLHSYGNHYYSARGSNENISLDPGHRWLLSLPLYHVGGLAILFRCILAGAALVVPDGNMDLTSALDRFDVTHVSLVSTQARRILADRSRSFDRLKAVLLGGGPVPSGIIDEAIDRGLPVHTSYGLTEMSSQVATTAPGARRDALQSSGTTLPFRQLHIAADGEILVRGRTLFQGFVKGRTVNRQRDEEGWYHTGDLGRIDDAGRLHVIGRMDNMFISGGENIHPETIESALEKLRAIEEAVVVPVRDDEFGARPAAFVRWRGEKRPSAAVRRDLSSSLARFKLPVAIFDWPEEYDAAGLKVDRERLRRRAERLFEH